MLKSLLFVIKMSLAIQHSQKYRMLLVISTIANVIIQLKSYLIIKLITYYFTKEQYAEYAFILNTSLFLSSLSVGGVVLSLNRYISETNEKNEKNKINSIISTSLITTIASLLLLTLGYFLINNSFNLVDFDNINIMFLIIGLYALLYSVYTIFYRYTLIFKKTKKYLLYFASYQFLGFAGVIIGLFVYKSIILIYVSILISQLVSFVFIIIEWKLRLVPRNFSFSYFKKIFRFGFVKQISESSYKIFYYLISILILYNLSENEYAEFLIANSVSLLLIFILSNISFNYQPHISTLKSLNTKESEKLIKRDIENTIKIFIFVSLGGIILITSIARYLVLFISTPEYINSAFMVYFLIIAQSIFFFTRIIGIGVFIKEKTGIELLISIFSIVLGLISSIFLGDKFGVFGYLSSFLIFVLVRAVLIFIISNRYLKISIDKFFIIKAIGIITVISGEYILAFSFNFLDYVAILVLPSYLFLTYILKLIDYKILFYQSKALFLDMISLIKNKKDHYETKDNNKEFGTEE